MQILFNQLFKAQLFKAQLNHHYKPVLSLRRGLVSFVLLFYSVLFLTPQLSFAQNATPSPTPKMIMTPTRRIVAPQRGQSAGSKFVSTSTPSTATTASEPSKFRFVYTAEYEGNRLFAPLDLSTSPDGTLGSAGIGHDFKLAYMITKKISVGVRPSWQQTLNSSFDPTTPTFSANDFKIYTNWGAMAETPDVRIDGGFQVVLPTSDAAQKAGRIIRFNLSANVTYKTSLRNWYFATVIAASPRFYKVNKPTTTDFGLVLVPIVAVDIAQNTQLQLEGALITNHLFGSSFFDFEVGDYDYFNLGPVFNLGDHFSINPAIRFYIAHFGLKAATTYLNFSVAL